MELKYEKKDIYSSLNEKELEDVELFTDDYIKFLNNCKTEYYLMEMDFWI